MSPSRVLEPFLIAAEQAVRQIYFRSDRLQAFRAARSAPPVRRILRLSELSTVLEGHGLKRGDVLMVHSALSKITVIDDRRSAGAEPEADPPAAAAKLISFFREIIGDEGTLVLPTFPKYPDEPPYLSPLNDGTMRYRFDPLRTPSKSGLMTEVFRVAAGSIRSRFPLQTVSASGPRARWIAGVDDAAPVGGLAHGPASAYGRLVEANGLVISLGVPLIDYCTVVHAAEDARYDTWPLDDFWRERHFDVVEGDRVYDVMVLERDPKYSRGYAEELLRRDSRRYHVLREAAAGPVECHALRAADLFDMMMRKNAHSSYPFLWPAISKL